MINSSIRLALLGSVSTALAVFILPGTAAATDTTCSQTGTTINCVDGATTILTATASPGTNTVSGTGLRTVDTTAPSTITYTAPGQFLTLNVGAVDLTSTGGALTFTPVATTAPVNVATIGGTNADAVTINAPGQAATVTVGNISTTGATSFGVRVLGATDLTLRTGDLSTTGAASRGIQATTPTANVSVTAGNINTTDRGVTTLSGLTNNNTTVVGNITAGAAGALASGGNVNLTTGNVVAANGFGVVGQALTGSIGNVVVRTGTVTASNGNGISANVFNATGSADIGGCSSVTNTAPLNSAIFSLTMGGNITINCGAVTSTGNSAVAANSQGGNILINLASATNNVGSAVFVTNTTGTVTTNAGVVNTSGPGGAGITVNSGTGAVDVGFTSIASSGLGGFGVTVNSTGPANLRGGSITTSGADAIGVRTTSAGLTGTLGNITATGTGSRGAVITSSAPVNLIVGNVATTGNGLTIDAGTSAVTLTTGTVTATEAGATGTVISSSGPITFVGGAQTANGANALRINGGAGAINATLAGAATTGTGTAVNITGSGPLTFANSGRISTVGANSTGLAIAGVTTTNVNCGNVSTTGANSPAVVVAANGTTNVTCGTVTTTGANSDAILVSNTAGTTTVTGGTTSASGAGSRGIVVTSSAPAATGLVTVNSGTVTANGNAVVASSTGGANVVVNATGNVTSTTGTGITATTGGTTLVTIGAGTTTTGVQGVSLQGDAGNTLIVNGTLRNTGGTTPFTVLNGGPFTLTLGATGTIIGPLAFTTGNDTFNNQAVFALPITLDFLAGNDVLNNSNTLTAFTGTSTLANLETLNNVGGLIDLRDGAANDTVTTSGNFVGSGASRLAIDFSSTASDRLVIGGAASGSTRIDATFVGTGLLNVPGTLVVDAGSSSAGAFTLGTVGGNTSTLVDYRLAQVGADFFLTASPNRSAFDPVAITTLANSLWHQSADEVFAQTDQPAVTLGASVWGQAYYSQDKFGDDNDSVVIGGTSFDVDNQVKTKRKGIQGGVDYGFDGARIGVTGGFGRANGDNDLNNDFRANGWNLGAYGQFGGYTGFHGAALIKYDRYKLRFESGAFDNERSRLTARGIDGSLGYRFGLGTTANLDAKVGLSHVRNKVDDINAFGFNYDIGRSTSTRGRAGVRATFGTGFAPYADATVYREFNGRRDVTLFDGANSFDIGTNGKATWARLEGGISSNGGPGPLLAAWADLGDKKGFGLRAGFRFGGRPVAALAPLAPVLEPVAPPPATQTCSDGSVILATDLCPAVAPPLPPAPPEAQPERG